MTHDLKCWVGFFEAVLDGRKPFEIRKNDRRYRVGDILHLREWDPIKMTYTDRSCARMVSYVTDWEQQNGYVVMGLIACL